MRDRSSTEQKSARFKILDDQRVSILDEDSTPRGDLRDERAVRLNGQHDRQVVFLA